MISQPPDAWYHIEYTCDILCTIFMTSYPLCKTTQNGVLLIPHSAYVWHHLHYRWYHFHSITPNQCLWCHVYYRHVITPTVLDITPTVPLSSQPLHWYHTQVFLEWILSYIGMKQPWVYMCSPSRSPLPPPSPPAPPRFSQCTRSECLSHASNLGWWSVSP